MTALRCFGVLFLFAKKEMDHAAGATGRRGASCHGRAPNKLGLGARVDFDTSLFHGKYIGRR